MKNRFLSLTVLLLFAATLSSPAQDKLFTAADYLNRDLQPESLSNLTWRGNTSSFTWIHDNCLVQKNAADPSAADTLLSLSALNEKMKAIKADELGRFPSVIWTDNDRFYFTEEGTVYLYDLTNDTLKKANEYDSDGENVTIGTKTLHVAYTVKNNLFVSVDGKTLQATDEKNEDIVYGQVPSRNEFGINEGMYWSPDGKQLAFYRIDQTEVTDYPQVDLTGRIAVAAPIKYPMAGMKSQKLKLGIFNFNLNEIVYLQTDGPENQYITSVTWSPEGKYIYAGILNRGQDHLKLNKYESSTGKLILTLFEERNDRYVEPLQGLYFQENDPTKFIWQSRRDGWNHLYLYDTEGNLIKQVTNGDWEVLNLLGYDPATNALYYESTMESPLERHLYKTNIKTGKTENITAREGIHRVNPSADMEYFIDIYSGLSMARAYYLLDSKGNKLSVLKEDADPYKDYKTGEMSIFTILSDDGNTDLYCRLIKPVDFDPAKKYPVIVYVYGGPHAQMINKSWTGGAGFFLYYLAQQDYVVFTLDNRGSANRGKEFESIIHRQLGEKEMEDQMAGIRYLKTLDYVDTTRIGVDGWSYGGFMTISLMLRNPGVFKVACAGGPVIDWLWYEVMYGERYMDTPMENPEGYKKSSLLNYAGNLAGKLLIIHGTSDPVVVWQNSLGFLDACISEGRQVDYFVYPGSGHNMTGKTRVHLFEKISGYFNDFLK
jgi:dipeptidyl-peptidase-4